MKYNNAKILFFVVLILPFILLSCRNPEKMQHAEQGIFLVENIDLGQNGPVNLRGDWKFRWLEDDPAFAKPGYDDSSWPVLATRGYWTKLTGSGTGYGWYRLHVKFNGYRPPAGTKLGLNFSYFNTSYEVYVNGIYAASSGKFGKSIHEAVPQILPRLVMTDLPPGSDEIVIAVRCSNFHHREGGFFETPQIGLYDDLRQRIWQKDFFNIFIIGLILMMGIYHLLIWSGRRVDRASLYFTIGCFIIFFRFMAVNSYYEMLFPGAGLFEFKMKMIYISLAAGAASFILFFYEIFPWGVNRRVLNLLIYVCITLVILTIVFPCRVYSRISFVYEGILLLSGVLMFIVTAIAAYKKMKWSGYLLPGCFFLFATGLNDLLVTKLVIDTPQIASAGLTGLMICQALVLSKRYSMVYNRAEHLSRNLQDEVAVKTGDLLDRTREAEEARRGIEKAHARLVEMESYRRIFFQNITHEFRTPLTIIIGYVERAMESMGKCDPAELNDQYNVILTNARMLLKLINQLLDISKIESEMMKVREEPVDLVKLIKSIASFFEYSAAQKGIAFTVSIDGETITGLFDCEKLEKIMYNLLSNAFKFTGENGRISVGVRSADDEVYITISDTGIGISSDRLPRIFDRFYQGDNSIKRVFEGTGIGLSLVREYVDLFNGRIEVTSTEGEGSVFTVILPLKKCGVSGDAGAKTDFEQVSGSAKIYLSDINSPVITRRVEETGTDDNETVLIVEDNTDMRSYLRETLKSRYTVKEASGGVEALAVVAECFPDLIISDIMMPAMDGFQLIAELKSNTATSHIPVILLTAKVGDDEKITGLECGADDYITKPFSARELLTRADSLVRLYRYQRMLSEKNRIIESELGVARAIQARLLITAASDYHENFFAYYRPYDKVAGDFYGYIEDGDSVHIFIADVSGHGVAAAFLSLVARNELGNLVRKGLAAAAVLEQLNNTICSYTVSGNFMTMFYCVYHTGTGILNYARAGHNPPVIVSREDGTVSELKPSGTALGIYAGLNYENGELHPGAGDRIVFYTDGLTECENGSREMFGTIRLLDIVKDSLSMNPEELSLNVMSHLEGFAVNGNFEDDITLLVFDIPQKK